MTPVKESGLPDWRLFPIVRQYLKHLTEKSAYMPSKYVDKIFTDKHLRSIRETSPKTFQSWTKNALKLQEASDAN